MFRPKMVSGPGLPKVNSVRVMGQTAIIIGKVDFNVSINQERRDFNFMYTEIYAKNEDKWKLVQYSFRNNRVTPK